jgi:hypothetical protein
MKPTRSWSPGAATRWPGRVPRGPDLRRTGQLQRQCAPPMSCATARCWPCPAASAPGGRAPTSPPSRAAPSTRPTPARPAAAAGPAGGGARAPPGRPGGNRLFHRAALRRVGAVAGRMERARPRPRGAREPVPDHSHRAGRPAARPAPSRPAPASRRRRPRRATRCPTRSRPPPCRPQPAVARPRQSLHPNRSRSPSPNPTSRFQRPVDGSILRAFSSANEGIDISAATGTAVRAAGDGEVAAITQDTDQVPILVIRHADGLLTVYANIRNITVIAGREHQPWAAGGRGGPGRSVLPAFRGAPRVRGCGPGSLLAMTGRGPRGHRAPLDRQPSAKTVFLER